MKTLGDAQDQRLDLLLGADDALCLLAKTAHCWESWCRTRLFGRSQQGQREAVLSLGSHAGVCPTNLVLGQQSLLENCGGSLALIATATSGDLCPESSECGEALDAGGSADDDGEDSFPPAFDLWTVEQRLAWIYSQRLRDLLSLVHLQALVCCAVQFCLASGCFPLCSLDVVVS